MKHIIAAMLLLGLSVFASAQEYYAPESPRIPERVWNPRYVEQQPVYRHPTQQPGPWYTPGSADDPFRSLRPLPWGSVGVVYVWAGYGWIPERRCRCW